MKAYTDIEQSKKLAEILPIESADHHYVRKVTDFMGNTVDGKWSHPKYGNPNSKYANYIVQNFISYEKLPCWSLSALLDYLSPNFLIDIKNINDKWELDCRFKVIKEEELVDSCYRIILKLKEKKLL